MAENEGIVKKLAEMIENELDELMFDIRETGITDFIQGEGYGYITCLEILKSLMPKSSQLLNYDIEDKYGELLQK